jgi:hypothetical protein
VGWTNPITWTVSQAVTSALLNAQLRDNMLFLMSPPRVSAYQTVIQSFPNNVETPVLLNAEQFDTDNMHSTITNTSRMTVVTPGVYDIKGSCGFALNSAGIRNLYISKNGVNLAANYGGTPTPGYGASLEVTCPDVTLAVGDYIEMQALQTSGAALNSVPDGTLTWLTMRLVGM